MIRRLCSGLVALLAVLLISLSWAQPAQAYDPNVKPERWAYNKGLIAPEYLNLRRGLVAHYVMWEGAGAPRDISGRGHHAAFPGGTSDPTWGISTMGLATLYDGNNDHFQVADHPDLDIGGNEFTWTVWAISDGNTGNVQVLFGKLQEYAVGLSSGASPEANIYFVGANTEGVSGTVLNFGQLYFLAFYWNEATGTWRIWVNGALDTNGSTGNASNSSTNPVLIGNDAVNNAWNGTIVEARIYNRLLSDSEIRLLYAAPFGDVWPEHARQPTDGLEAEAAAPSTAQIIIISWATTLASLTFLAYCRRRNDARFGPRR